MSGFQQFLQVYFFDPNYLVTLTCMLLSISSCFCIFNSFKPQALRKMLLERTNYKHGSSHLEVLPKVAIPKKLTESLEKSSVFSKVGGKRRQGFCPTFTSPLALRIKER